MAKLGQRPADKYPRNFGYLPVAQEKQARVDYDRRRRKRIHRNILKVGIPLVAAAVLAPIVGNHILHDRAVGKAEQLDKARAKDRLELALPYRETEVLRVTDTHQVDQGLDPVRLKLWLPFTDEAAKIPTSTVVSGGIDSISPPGAVVYPVKTVGKQPTITPLTGKYRPGMLPGSLLFPLTTDPTAEPKFSEPFQGRNSGAQFEMDGNIGTVTVELPASDAPGSQVAVYVANEATSEENGYLNQTQGEEYVTTLRLVRGEHGEDHWQVMQRPPQFPDMYGDAHDKAPNGATL